MINTSNVKIVVVILLIVLQIYNKFTMGASRKMKTIDSYIIWDSYIQLSLLNFDNCVTLKHVQNY